MERTLPNFLMGAGLFHGFTNTFNNFRVSRKHLGSGDISVTIQGPSKPEIKFKDKRGNLYVSYKVTCPGLYVIDCKFRGQHFAGSPFLAKITHHEEAASKFEATGDGLKYFRSGEVTKFHVTCLPYGIGVLDVVVKDLNPYDVLVYPYKDGFGVNYTPQFRGWYEILVMFNGIQIPSSPFLAVCQGENNLFMGDMFYGAAPDQYDEADTEDDNFMQNHLDDLVGPNPIFNNDNLIGASRPFNFDDFYLNTDDGHPVTFLR